jgi:hypothetical protein
MSRDRDAEEFRDNIRKYNNALAFTSVGAQVDRRYARGGEGHYTYRIQGELFHQMGTLLPVGDEAPNFAQLYICDPERELDERQVFMKRDCMRMLLIISSFSPYCLFKKKFHFYFTVLFFFFCRLRRFEKLDARTLQSLQNMLHRHNPYAQLFLHARQRVQEDTVEFSIRLLASRVHDPRRYNAPTVEEIGALIVGGGDLSTANGRDIVLQTTHGTFQRIPTLHVSYSPLHFVLLFPDGRDGWHPDIPLQGFERNGEAFIAEDVDAVTGRNGSMRVTQLDYYAYMLQMRANETWILRAGKLLQQFMVDAWACVEQNRLQFFRNHQATLRTELYSGLQDALTAEDTDAVEIGQRFIHPVVRRCCSWFTISWTCSRVTDGKPSCNLKANRRHVASEAET